MTETNSLHSQTATSSPTGQRETFAISVKNGKLLVVETEIAALVAQEGRGLGTWIRVGELLGDLCDHLHRSFKADAGKPFAPTDDSANLGKTGNSFALGLWHNVGRLYAVAQDGYTNRYLVPIYSGLPGSSGNANLDDAVAQLKNVKSPRRVSVGHESSNEIKAPSLAARGKCNCEEARRRWVHVHEAALAGLDGVAALGGAMQLGPDGLPVIGAKIAAVDGPVCSALDANAVLGGNATNF